VFGEDGLQHGRIGTHGFIHRRWTDILGYYAPMHFHVFFHDTWLNDIAESINRRVYRKDLLFEHMHPDAKKAAPDQNTIRMASLSRNDAELFRHTSNIRREHAQKLKDAIKQFSVSTPAEHNRTPNL
jgi:hypothetical protein